MNLPIIPSGFIGADAFLGLAATNRVVWFSGRYGGGKTTGGMWLAAWLIASGRADKMLSNIPSPMRQNPIKTPVENAVIFLDESWIFLETWRAVKGYAGFVRKFNHYLILPSVFPPHLRLRSLSCQRVFNAMVIGFPLWVYQYNLTSGVNRERGYFGIGQPHKIFNFLDTKYIPADDGGIVDALNETLRERTGKRAEVKQTGKEEGGLAENQDLVNELVGTLADTAEQTARAEQTIQRIRKRLGR